MNTDKSEARLANYAQEIKDFAAQIAAVQARQANSLERIVNSLSGKESRRDLAYQFLVDHEWVPMRGGDGEMGWLECPICRWEYHPTRTDPKWRGVHAPSCELDKLLRGEE